MWLEATSCQLSYQRNWALAPLPSMACRENQLTMSGRRLFRKVKDDAEDSRSFVGSQYLATLDETLTHRGAYSYLSKITPPKALLLADFSCSCVPFAPTISSTFDNDILADESRRSGNVTHRLKQRSNTAPKGTRTTLFKCA